MASTGAETTLSARAAALLLGCFAVGALLLIVAEFLPLYEIRTVTVVPEGGRKTTGAHHGYALLVVGLALLPMAWGAIRGGSRPAAFAALALALIALLVALAIDLPDLNETGLIGRNYDEAEARPKIGFFLETLGATLALLAAVGALVLTPRR